MLHPQLKKVIDDIWDTFVSNRQPLNQINIPQIASKITWGDLTDTAMYNEHKCGETENKLNPNGHSYLETNEIQQSNICEVVRDQINVEIAKLPYVTPWS